MAMAHEIDDFKNDDMIYLFKMVIVQFAMLNCQTVLKQ